MAIITDGVRTKFTDDLGQPLIGGQVFSYVEGTSTPKDTYIDREFTIPNTNPIILDDVGSCVMYLQGGYRLRVLTAEGVLVEEKDNAFQSDGAVLDVVANTTAITNMNASIDAINTRGVLKLDVNNHIIGQGNANSATVYDISLRSDKARVSAPNDVEFGGLIFTTYTAPTVVNGVTIPIGTWLNPSLITPVLGTAATKNTGIAVGAVPLAENVFRAANQKLDAYITSGGNANTLVQGDRVLFSAASNMAEHLGTLQVIECHAFHAVPNVFRQEAYNYDNGDMSTRLSKSAGLSAWKPITTHKSNYNTTTAAGANVAVDSTGALLRSTSSERYKDILAPLVLDDVKYANAMQLAPIVYRSTADADNPLHHYYSFSAEALGAFDPAFTLWRYTEQVTDADGVTTEQPLAEKQAEGLNINALLAMSHAIAIKQDGLIKVLEARIAALEATPTTTP